MVKLAYCIAPVTDIVLAVIVPEALILPPVGNVRLPVPPKIKLPFCPPCGESIMEVGVPPTGMVCISTSPAMPFLLPLPQKNLVRLALPSCSPSDILAGVLAESMTRP